MHVGHSLRWVSIYGEVFSIWSSGVCAMASVGTFIVKLRGDIFHVSMFKPGSDQSAIYIYLAVGSVGKSSFNQI